MKKRRFVLILLILVCGVAGSTGFVLRSQVTSMHSHVAVTIVKTTRLFDASGAVVHTYVDSKGVRPDGSTAELKKVLDGRVLPDHFSVVFDVPSRTRLALDPFSKSRTTYRLEPKWVEHIALSPTCPAARGAETKVIMGYATFRATEKTGHAGEQTISESWIAPDLNCETLGEVVTSVRSGSPNTHNEMDVLSVAIGEPNATMFSAPSEYVERSPTQVFQELAKLNSAPCLACSAPGMAMKEQAYNGRQAR